MYNYWGDRTDMGLCEPLWSIHLKCQSGTPEQGCMTGHFTSTFWKGKQRGTGALKLQYHKKFYDLSRSTWNKFIEAIRAHIKFRMVFYTFCYYFLRRHYCWTCKCEENNYYGCAFTLNSTKTVLNTWYVKTMGGCRGRTSICPLGNWG